MRDFVIVLIVFGSIPFILVRPQIGILMWYWISLMNPHRLAYGYAYSFRVALVVAVATLIAWAYSKEKKVPPATIVTYWLVAFTVWITISTFAFALVPASALELWERAIKILGFTLLAMCIVDSQQRIKELVWVVVLSIGFYAIKGGIFGILTGGNYRVWGPEDSFIGDNNSLALAITMIIPMMYYLMIESEWLWLRVGMMGAMGCAIIAVLCTYSRGGFLALGITLCALLTRVKRRFMAGIIVFVVVLGSLAVLPQTWYDRMDTIQNYQQDASAMERIVAWTFALRLAADYPIAGGGFGVVDDRRIYFHYSPEADAVHNFHSIYFQVLGENGYVGLTLFLGLIFSTLASAQWIVRRTRRRPEFDWARNLAQAIQVATVGFMSAGAFVNLGFYDLFYALVAIIVAVRVVVAKALAAERRAAQRTQAGFAPAPGAPRPSLVTGGGPLPAA